MDLDFSSGDELFELIKQINEKYYNLLNVNILFLEEYSDRIYVVYITVLRDAYAHLVRAFDSDIHDQQGKKNVQQQLELYVNHLRRGLLDTFRKILALEFKSLMELVKSVNRKNVKVIEYQIATEAYKLRVMDKNNSADKRIEGYISLMEYLSDVRKKIAPVI